MRVARPPLRALLLRMLLLRIAAAPDAPGAGASPSGNANEMVAVGGLNGAAGAAGPANGSSGAPEVGAPITGNTPVPLIPGTERYDCSPPTGTSQRCSSRHT